MNKLEKSVNQQKTFDLLQNIFRYLSSSVQGQQST